MLVMNKWYKYLIFKLIFKLCYMFELVFGWIMNVNDEWNIESIFTFHKYENSEDF